jgi:hypothetical protein
LLRKLPHQRWSGQASCPRFRRPRTCGQTEWSIGKLKLTRTSILHREGDKSLSLSYCLREQGKVRTCAVRGRIGIAPR